MKKGEQKQTEILNFLIDYLDNHPYPPSYREIALGVGIKSTNSIKKYLDILEEKNLIRRNDYQNRSIQIVRKDYSNAKDLVKIPLIGKVSAGIPILAVENIEDEFIVSKSIFGTNQELFMLKISGDSMIEVGINDGDYVVVKKQETAQNGEIVVACLEEYATVKTFYKDNNKIILQPQNPLYQRIVTTSCQILGKVVGCIKKF